MNIYDLIQLTWWIILSVWYIPQIIQIRNSKNSDSLNLTTFLSIFTWVALMEVYALNLFFNLNTGFMFLLTNTISLTLISILLFYITKYRTSSILPNIEFNSISLNLKRAFFKINKK